MRLAGQIRQAGSYNLSPALMNGNKGLLMATAFVFVSYAGVTKVAAITEEIKNPTRNLPIAMLTALLLVTLIYVNVEASAGFDLLVTGQPREGSWSSILFGHHDQFVQASVCSVLRLTFKV